MSSAGDGAACLGSARQSAREGSTKSTTGSSDTGFQEAVAFLNNTLAVDYIKNQVHWMAVCSPSMYKTLSAVPQHPHLVSPFCAAVTDSHQ